MTDRKVHANQLKAIYITILKLHKKGAISYINRNICAAHTFSIQHKYPVDLISKKNENVCVFDHLIMCYYGSGFFSFVHSSYYGATKNCVDLHKWRFVTIYLALHWLFATLCYDFISLQRRL